MVKPGQTKAKYANRNALLDYSCLTLSKENILK